MCRLFCSISISERKITDDVLRSEYSIFRQVKEEGHSDGWGMFEYSNGNLHDLLRNTNSLSESLDFAEAILENGKSDCTGFFVRKATNPLKLSRDRILTLEATQPFTHGSISFMHNGTVYSADKALESSRGLELTPISTSDSEVYFALFLHRFLQSRDAFNAFKSTEDFLIKTNIDAGGAQKEPFSSINSIVTDGNRVYAFNRYNRNTRKGVSNPERDYYEMCYKATDSNLIVASEPTDDGNWMPVGNGRMLEAWRENGSIKFTIKGNSY